MASPAEPPNTPESGRLHTDRFPKVYHTPAPSRARLRLAPCNDNHPPLGKRLEQVLTLGLVATALIALCRHFIG